MASQTDEPPAGTTSPSLSARWTKSALDELGLLHLWISSINVKLLCLQRFVRLFAYGASALILVAYLHALGFSDSSTGLFMTLTAGGDVVISFGLTLIADKMGRRKILAAGSILMATSGIVFAVTDNYWLLLLAAVLGVITPSGNEIGPFRAIEESMLAHLTKPDERNSIFAWYVLLGSAATALGLVTCGWVTTLLVQAGWRHIAAYRAVFLAYAAMGGIKLILSLVLGTACELDNRPSEDEQAETAPLLAENGFKGKRESRMLALLPHLSRESKIILVKLCLLFVLDNFGTGLSTLTWTANYFERRFSLTAGETGSLLFTVSVIVAISILFSASLARRIGNIRTMVYTHLPASICLALIGLPSQPHLAIALLLLRGCTQSMDTAPRAAFVAAIVLPEERTVTVGMVNVVKTLCQSLGPLVTGVLAERDLFWVAFLMAGCLKVAYDIGLWVLFAGHKTREERLLDADDDST